MVQAWEQGLHEGKVGLKVATRNGLSPYTALGSKNSKSLAELAASDDMVDL